MNRVFSFRTAPLGALLVSLSAFAQTDVPVAGEISFKPYLGNRDQFTLDIPDGWHVVDQSPYSDKGVIAFYSQPMQLKIDKNPVIARQQEQDFEKLLAGMESGEIPSFFIDRYKADKGMTCAGFDARAQKKKVKIFLNAGLFGNKSKTVGAPEVASAPVGGCQGLRVLIRANTAVGTAMQMLVYSAAVDGITYDLALVAEPQYFDQSLLWFERVVSSMRLAGAS